MVAVFHFSFYPERFHAILLDFKSELTCSENTPFTFKLFSFMRKLMCFSSCLLITTVLIRFPRPGHIYLGMFEFIFGQYNARDWSAYCWGGDWALAELHKPLNTIG